MRTGRALGRRASAAEEWFLGHGIDREQRDLDVRMYLPEVDAGLAVPKQARSQEFLSVPLRSTGHVACFLMAQRRDCRGGNTTRNGQGRYGTRWG